MVPFAYNKPNCSGPKLATSFLCFDVHIRFIKKLGDILLVPWSRNWYLT